jgi:hypothetical protein
MGLTDSAGACLFDLDGGRPARQRFTPQPGRRCSMSDGASIVVSDLSELLEDR